MSTPLSPAPVGPAGWTLQALPAPPARDHAGELFAGRYLMRRRIGGGGMSTIHEARDTHLGMRVAVKIIRSDLPSDPVDRFRREAHVLAALTHEHIARILDRQDPEEGPRFLVTEFIDGIDLSQLRRRGALPSAVVLRIGLQATAALADVHAAGVIHRDINPSNLMLVRHTSGDVFIKVIDFGIAKLEHGSEIAAPENAPPGARRATRGDVVLGTAPYYCGHEGPRRDVYALALTLAELLTGKSPDPATTLTNANIPPALARVITTALRDDEMATMEAFHAALREADIQAPETAEAARRHFVAQAFAKQPTANTSPTADEAPRFAGRYIVSGELGQGGMGRVRTAFDPQNRRMVALKTISPRCAGMKSLEYRFRREARALAAIEHHGAPTLYESGSEPEHFFTMEIVEGVTLAATLKRGKLEPHRALDLAIGLGEILCAAHEAGVIHRDVKPENIVISHGDRVRLLDFGACLLMPRFHQRHLLFPATPAEERYATGELEAVGTPGYSAPEVLSLEGGSGPRSDVYSVCAVLYEMLTGRPLVDRATHRAHVIERNELPASLASVADLLRRGSELESADRVWTMTDLVRGLEIARGGLTHARELRRLLWAVMLAVLSTAAIVALVMQLPARTPTVTQDAMAGSALASQPPVETPPPAPLMPPSPPAADIQAAPTPVNIAPPATDPKSFDRGSAASPPRPLATDSLAPPSPATDERPVALTRSMVETRITTRANRLKTNCALQWIALDVKVSYGRAKLLAVNGMTFSADDPTHACVRKELQQLTFPVTAKAAQFSMTIDLNRPAPRTPR